MFAKVAIVYLILNILPVTVEFVAFDQSQVAFPVMGVGSVVTTQYISTRTTDRDPVARNYNRVSILHFIAGSITIADSSLSSFPSAETS